MESAGPRRRGPDDARGRENEGEGDVNGGTFDRHGLDHGHGHGHDHDSSTAMSLDESSIQLDATATSASILGGAAAASAASVALSPLSPGADGAASFARPRPPRRAPPTPGSASASAAMSISGAGTPTGPVGFGKGGAFRPSDGPSSAPNGHRGDGSAASSTKDPPRPRPTGVAPPAPASDWNSAWDLEDARTRLRRASWECGRRGLKLAGRWASEQLVGLAPPPASQSQPQPLTQGGVGATATAADLSPLSLAEELCRPNDLELHAASLLDLGEHARAAHVLSCPPAAPLSASSPSLPSPDDSTLPHAGPPRADLTPFGIQVRAYELYLDGERRREERATELRDPLERTSARNPELPRLEAELRRADARGELDAFGLYVYGAVLRGIRGTRSAPRPARDGAARSDGGGGGGGAEEEGDAAHRVLVRSVLLYPFNWSAWLDLGGMCVEDPSIEREVEGLLAPIAGHWMYHFFCVHVFVDNRSNEDAIAVIERLAHGDDDTTTDDGLDNADSENGMGREGKDSAEGGAMMMTATSSGFFVQSAYLQSQLAMAYYDVRDYDSAHEHFLALSEREPYRLEHMDAFSNVLYVKDQKVALSHLAHRSVSVDKYRPETCVVVGNYYSSRGRHEKAAQYFQRALKLDRSYLPAWTLLGHEYVEMKNTSAAIEAYRRAVDLCGREYRAWYGLGQTYEIMGMLLHALFYFRKAAGLHPHDARMWCAIGGCLLGLDRRADAERSYERAVSLGDGEGIATRRLAELYREDGDEERAARCYLRHLELRYRSQLPGSYSGDGADASPESFKTVITNVRVDEPEAEALLYLAYYYRDNIEYDQAVLCAARLEDYPGPEKEQGKGLLRDLRSRMDRKAGGGGSRRGAGGPSAASTLPSTTPAMERRRGGGGGDSPMGSSFEFSP
ncbi:hypothetical protein ACHAWF_005387 [Thalassiosira exigua]